jgi:hypothetical protein
MKTNNYTKLKHIGRLLFTRETEKFREFKIEGYCNMMWDSFVVSKSDDLEWKTPKQYCEYIADLALQYLFDWVRLINFPEN